MAEALGSLLVDPQAAASGSAHTHGKWLSAVATPRAALLGLTGAGIATYLLASLLSQPATAPDPTRAEAQLAPLADQEPLGLSPAPAAQPAPAPAEGAPVLQEPAPQRQHRAPSVASERTRRTTARPAERPSAGTLLEEVRLLDTIRSALRAGEVQAAAHTLRRYTRRHPRGELRNEHAVLELELLMARGERAAARERARALLEQPGMQRYAPHLRAILQRGEHSPERGSDTGSGHIRARR
jgi:hypothetical protein